MRWEGALLGHGNRPGDVLADAPAVAAAARWGSEATDPAMERGSR